MSEKERKQFQIIEKMMSGLGDEIDPAMMSALMATTALVAAGASNEEVSTRDYFPLFPVCIFIYFQNDA